MNVLDGWVWIFCVVIQSFCPFHVVVVVVVYES